MKMMWSYTIFQLIFSLLMIKNMDGLSSPITPFTTYDHSIELLANTADLWWSVDNAAEEITFEYHVNTTGWIALGISPAGGMTGADIGVGGLTETGQIYFQDRYAYNYSKPVIDNHTDWFGLQGREQDGWTAIQFKRLLVTCDPMDVPIRSGSTIVIFAWGIYKLTSFGPNDDLTYHENRRGSVTIPLLSYSEPPSDENLAILDKFEFRVNNYTLPAVNSLYYCQVFKVPASFTYKRHIFAREILINSSAPNLVYHLTLNECDAESQFDDENLPSGNCDDRVDTYAACSYNIVIGWATGGDYLFEYPEEAGLPIGLDFPIKYYMLQINYYNADSGSNYIDNSGIRFYVGSYLRAYDLGGLSFGVSSTPSSLAIPPNVNAFSVDSYCTANASLNNIPDTGVTVFSFFGHTHLQGKSVWTKVIHNKTAVQYLYDIESYDPNYQFEYRLSQPITLYPGDEFATRCVYNTMNKAQITLGGRLPSDEMCVQVVSYYPRVSNLYTCASTIAPTSWQALMNATTPPDDNTLSEWLLNLTWTSNLTTQFQTFYNNATRILAFGRAEYYTVSSLASLPTYEDLNNNECVISQNNTNITGPVTTGMPTITGYNQTNNSNISSTTISSNVNITTMPVATTIATNITLGPILTPGTTTTTTAAASMATTAVDMATTTTTTATTTIISIMVPATTVTTITVANTTTATTTIVSIMVPATTVATITVANTTTAITTSTTTSSTDASNNLVVHQAVLILLLLISFLVNRITV